VSLTLHKNLNYLSCHYCGYTYQIPQKCPQCGCDGLYNKGFGTEKIEEVVQQLFPLARIARMDLDTTRTKNAYERLINDFSLGKTNVLIGTQMVSKGLDFDNVKVVGIIDADSMLNYPDFRSYEYSFAMLAQVAGRAGRKGEQGRVILQTKNTELPIISQIASNDYSTFYKETELERKAFYYPPFYRLICVYLKYKKEEVVNEAAIFFGNQIKNIFTGRNHTIRLRHQFRHSTRIAGEIQTRRGNAAVLAQSGKNADRKMQAVAKHNLMPAAFGEARPFQRHRRKMKRLQ